MSKRKEFKVTCDKFEGSRVRFAFNAAAEVCVTGWLREAEGRSFTRVGGTIVKDDCLNGVSGTRVWRDDKTGEIFTFNIERIK